MATGTHMMHNRWCPWPHSTLTCIRLSGLNMSVVFEESLDFQQITDCSTFSKYACEVFASTGNYFGKRGCNHRPLLIFMSRYLNLQWIYLHTLRLQCDFVKRELRVETRIFAKCESGEETQNIKCYVMLQALPNYQSEGWGLRMGLKERGQRWIQMVKNNG